MNGLGALTVILLITLAGAFGGAVEFLRHVTYVSGMLTFSGHTIRLSNSFFAMLITSSFVGAAGALGVAFVFILLKSFSNENTVENIVLLVSISVAAGFGARSILPGLVRRLEEQIENVEAKTNKLEARVEQVKDEVKDDAEENAEYYAKIMIPAAVPAVPTVERQWSLEELSRLTQQQKTHRSFHLMLGRIHRLNDNLDNYSGS
jgi:hypothetical protein